MAIRSAKIDQKADLIWAIADKLTGPYKPVADTSLRDIENVPLKEDINAYFEREVLPFAPDAWIDEKKSKVGYEIPFTRYFYKYEAPRPSEEIMELEKELSGSLEEVFR